LQGLGLVLLGAHILAHDTTVVVNDEVATEAPECILDTFVACGVSHLEHRRQRS
jgi:hypothetical protein